MPTDSAMTVEGQVDWLRRYAQWDRNPNRRKRLLDITTLLEQMEAQQAAEPVPESELERLRIALTESVALQSHYASLLNMHFGGHRLTFTPESWIARLAELGKLTTPPQPPE
jgi:hypothetical protein